MAESIDNMLVARMPLNVWNRLIVTLNSEEAWRRLGVEQMRYNDEIMSRIQSADDLLTYWKRGNPTVNRLWCLLRENRNHEAMEAIKSCVRESLHHEIEEIISLNNASRSRHSTTSSLVTENNSAGINTQNKNVPFEELKLCCNNFDTLIGKGGYGEVYRGTRFCQKIAVKCIRSDKIRNPEIKARIIKQFIVEINAMHNFPADNILRLMYYSYTEDLSTDPCLVYQYMPNGSVSDRLRCAGGTAPLTWKQRATIAFQVAKGLCHLHGNNIIHGDIKSGNILLDENFKAQIADFGLARGGPDSEEDHKTVSCVFGTPWYLPDDYARNRHLTKAVDTFCYGIFLFSLVTGEQPSYEYPENNKPMRDIMLGIDPHQNIDEFVQKYADKEMGYDYWARILYVCGYRCARQKHSDRPQMSEVYDLFEGLMTEVPDIVTQDIPDYESDASTILDVTASGIMDLRYMFSGPHKHND